MAEQRKSAPRVDAEGAEIALRNADCTINKSKAQGIGNGEFLTSIFKSTGRCWVTSFPDNPATAPGSCWAGRHSLPGDVGDRPDCNAYFSVAAFKNDSIARTYANFLELAVVVLDDAKACPLAPTWVLRTSPEKFQIGYLLAEPVRDIEIAKRLHKALAENGHILLDRNGNNGVRYVRLPRGINTKHNPPFPCALEIFERERAYTLSELIDGLGLDADFIINGQQERRAQAPPTGGFIPEGSRNSALTSMAGVMRRRNMSQAGIEAALQVENATRCYPPLTENEVEAIARSVARYAPEGGPVINTWPPPLDLQALSRYEPEKPKFIVADWLPCGYATLFAGHGGVGKSGIALTLAVCIAAGVPFFGLPTQRRRVIYLSCEDRVNVLHWRLARICAHVGLDMASLNGWLEVLDLVGHQTILWQHESNSAALTAAHDELRACVKSRESQVVFVDGISDAFGGNENARGDVKAFVNTLLALIPPADGAVMLVGHVGKPAATAAATSEGYSGSTGWHNSVRARWYLYPESRAEDGAMARTGDLVLELQKSNLGPTDRALRFKWDEAAQMFVGSLSGIRADIDRLAERSAVLAALRACAEPVPAALTGPRTAYHVLSCRPEFPASLKTGDPAKRRFRRYIEELRAMRAVVEGSISRSDRHRVRVIVAAGAGCGDAGHV